MSVVGLGFILPIYILSSLLRGIGWSGWKELLTWIIGMAVWWILLMSLGEWNENRERVRSDEEWNRIKEKTWEEWEEEWEADIRVGGVNRIKLEEQAHVLDSIDELMLSMGVSGQYTVGGRGQAAIKRSKEGGK